MSTICFETKIYVSIHKQNDQTRSLYSTLADGTSSRQHLIRETNSVFNKDLHEESQRDSGLDIQQPAKAYKYVIDGSSMIYPSSTNNFGSFDSVRDKSIALCVDFGLSSSLWILGRHSNDLSASNHRDLGFIESALGGFASNLFDMLLVSTEGTTNFTRNQYTVNIKCYEVFGDQIRDLIAISSPVESPTVMNGSNKTGVPRVREHPVAGAFVAGLSQRTCATEAEARQTLLQAYDQRLVLLCADNSNQPYSVKGAAATPVAHRVLGTVGNVIIVLEVQQELSFATNGFTEIVSRSASVQFNVLSDIEPLTFKPLKSETIATTPLRELKQACSTTIHDTTDSTNEGANTAVMLSPDVTSSVQVSQLTVCAKSVAALSRVVTLLQQNGETTNTNGNMESAKIQHIPYRESTLSRVLQPMLEGKYVNYVHCSLDEPAELAGATLATAAYALRLSSEMKAGVRSRVVPNEQLLSRRMISAVSRTDDGSVLDANNLTSCAPGISEAAQIAREAAHQASNLALEGIVRVMNHSTDAVLDQGEAALHLAENNRNAAFWDLFHSMRAEGPADYLDLERLQLERTRLLNSLDGIIVRADTSVASRVQNGIDGHYQHDSFSELHTMEEVVDVGAQRGGVSQIMSVLEENSIPGYNLPHTPPLPPNIAVTSAPDLATVRSFNSTGLAASPNSLIPLNPLQARPGSTSSLPRSGSQTLGLSILHPLSPEQPSSPGASHLHSSTSSTSPLKPVYPKPTAKTSTGSSSSKNFTASKLTAPNHTVDLQAHTARSQSVKGPRMAALSPVEAPTGSSSKGRAVAAAGALAIVRTSARADKSLLRSADVLTNGGKAPSVKTNFMDDKARSAVKVSTPPTQVTALLAPVRAGKVTVKANGLKTFDQAALYKSPLSPQGNFLQSSALSSPTEEILNSASSAKSTHSMSGPEVLAPLQRRGGSPNTAMLARQGGGFNMTTRSMNAHPSNGDAFSTKMPQTLSATEQLDTTPTSISASTSAVKRDELIGIKDPELVALVSVDALQVTESVVCVDEESLLALSQAHKSPVFCHASAIKDNANAESAEGLDSMSPSIIPLSTQIPPSSPSFLPSCSLPPVLSPRASAAPTLSEPNGVPESVSRRAEPSPPVPSARESRFVPDIVSPNQFGARSEPALSRKSKTRSSLPSERQELSAAHEDAQGSHLSELETQYLRAVSHTVPGEVARCIRMGVNVRVKNSFGRDAMQIAARNGAAEILTLVHEHGGEISSRGPKGDTLYHLAASNGHINVFEWLSEHVFRGAGLAGDSVDMYGQTPAHVAARRGEVAVLKYLHHTLGVDILQEDFDGRTPLEAIPKLSLGGNAEGLVQAREFLTSVIELK